MKQFFLRLTIILAAFLPKQVCAKGSHDHLSNSNFFSYYSDWHKAPHHTGEVKDTNNIITTPAEGEHKFYTRAGDNYYVSNQSLYISTQSGNVEIVECSDGTIYIKDPVSTYAQGTWAKGTKAGNTITVPAHQPLAYNTNYATTLSLRWGLVTAEGSASAADDHADSFTYTIDGNVITLQGTAIYDGTTDTYCMGVVWDDDDSFSGYGDANSVYTLIEGYEERLVFFQDSNYYDNQVISTETTTLILGNDQCDSTSYWHKGAFSCSDYLSDISQEGIFINDEGDEEEGSICVSISGYNNPKDQTNNDIGSGFNAAEENTIGKLPQSGTYYIVETRQTGWLTAGVILSSGKEFYVIDATDAVMDSTETYLKVTLPEANIMDYTLIGPDGELDLSNESLLAPNNMEKGGVALANTLRGFVKFHASAGHKYYFFSNGSKLRFLGYTFKPGKLEFTETVTAFSSPSFTVTLTPNGGTAQYISDSYYRLGNGGSLTLTGKSNVDNIVSVKMNLQDPSRSGNDILVTSGILSGDSITNVNDTTLTITARGSWPQLWISSLDVTYEGTPPLGTYAIRLPQYQTNGSVTSSRDWADEGDEVTLTATPQEGYHLSHLYANRGAVTLSPSATAINQYTFTMPAEDVTIGAVFAEGDITTGVLLNVPECNEANAAPIYNLQGQRLKQLQRGVNIVGGRKKVGQ